MDRTHPHPQFLAHVVNDEGHTLAYQIETACARALEISRAEHACALETYRAAHEKATAHALEAIRVEHEATRREMHDRLEVLEARWYERLAKWLRRER